MSTILRLLLFLVLPLAAIAAVVWWFTRPQPVPVRTAPVARGVVEATVANTRAGTVHARRRAKLAPAVGGQIAALPVAEGDRVAEGQVLLELWNQDLRAQLQQARAELQQAEARQQEACLRAANLQQEAERMLQLQKEAIAAGERVDRAVTEAKAAEAACRAAGAAIGVIEAQTAVIQARLEETVLRAPFAGVVAEINAEVGEYSTPSPPGIPTLPAIDLIDTSGLYVKAPIDEVDAPRVRPGQPARITLDAFPGRAFEGVVRRVAPYVEDREKQARTVDVEVDFVDVPQEVRLLPGYSADVEVVLEVRENVLRVPTEAVLEGKRVLVLDAASATLREAEFERGVWNWHWTEVRRGLEPGQPIVVSLSRDGVRAGVAAVREATPDGP